MEAAEGPIYAVAYAHAMAVWLQFHGTRNQGKVRLSAEDQATMHRACHERGQEARAANTHTYVRYKSHTSKSATIAMIMPGVGCVRLVALKDHGSQQGYLAPHNIAAPPPLPLGTSMPCIIHHIP